jgi:uncharacterized protein (TIGR00251 family)
MSTQLPPWLKEEDSKTNTCVLALYCQPGAKKTEVQGEHDGRLKIRLAAPPVEGKANDALILWLSKTLNIHRSAIELLAGDLSRLKRVRVSGADSQAIVDALTI